MASKLLIIDDSEDFRVLASKKLGDMGYAVAVWPTGTGSLEAIRAESPDLVLLDIVMPQRDGKEVLKEIRQLYSPVDLPVIMMTASVDNQDLLAAFDLGANDFVLKTTDFKVVARRIESHLKLVGLSRQVALLKELEAIRAVIIAFNHEINSPLMAALAYAENLQEEHPENPQNVSLTKSLLSIVEILKKTSDILPKTSVEFETYMGEAKMLKLPM